MRNHPLRLVALAFVLLAARPTSAQQPPRPGAEVTRLTALAGTFDGEATFTASGHTSHFTLHHENRVIAGGFGLGCREDADVPGLGHYAAENLLGWDAGQRQLHLLTVSNDPNTHDHAGPWTDATHATLRYAGVRDGKPMTEVIAFEVTGPDAYRFRSTVTVPGRPAEVFEAFMKRTATVSAR